MPARALPFPWNDYLRFQSVGDGRTANPASFGHDDALAACVDELGLSNRPVDSASLCSQFENLCCNRAAKHRRRVRLTEQFAERQCSSKRRKSMGSMLQGRRPLCEDHAAKVAISELLDLLRQGVREADWPILWMLAEGYSYAEVAARLGVKNEALKSRISRLRSQIRNSTVGKKVQAAMF